MTRVHVHDPIIQRIGPGLERSVCSECGHVSIRSVLRPATGSGREEPLRLFAGRG